MRMHEFRGLNCHLGCMVNLAEALGIDCTKAFASLWSEMEFAWDEEYQIFSTKRAYQALTALGLELLPASPALAAQGEEGAWFFAGMDSSHIPWCKAHRNYGGSHYFMVQKQNAQLLCFDPMYREAALPLQPEQLAHGFQFSRAQRRAAPPWNPTPAQEARDFLRSYPAAQAFLRRELQAFPQKDRRQMLRLLRQIEAMINNRHLFARFACRADAWGPLFSPAFFGRWDAVKYGLLKASILEHSAALAAEVSDLLLGLLAEERALAQLLCR